MTFLKRFFLVLFARGCGGLRGVIGRFFLLGELGRIGCRGWRTLVFYGVRFLGNFSDFFETGLLWLKKYSYLAVGLERNGLVSCTTGQ